MAKATSSMKLVQWIAQELPFADEPGHGYDGVQRST